jgi:diadenosine tetraphosphate (Ap4A) HIT family hydrolase
MTACPFCTEPSINGRVIAKDDLVFAFPTNIPITPGHTLIAPIRCVPLFSDLTKTEAEALLVMRSRISAALQKAFGAEGFHFVWNEGTAAGQSVSHFHLHVVPRKAGDSGITEYEPRKFLYRPGSREISKESELQAVAQLLKKSL